jgi:hypothetical protein
VEIVVGIVVGLLIAGGVAVAARRRGPAPRAGLAPPADPLADAAGGGVESLGVGAVVALEGRDFVVRGSVEFDEDGYTWSEHHLDDLEVRRWVSVDTNDGTDVRIWQEAEGAEGLEPANQLEWGGATWRQVEHGRASFRSVGTTGLPASGTAWYADLRSTADPTRWLAFERWSAEGSWEVSTGETVPAERLDVFPAGRSSGL